MTIEGREILQAVEAREPVSGLTHCFYKYPARFSPRFAHVMIQAFTNPGDVVFDPFMGGGTTVVEARTLRRSAIGTDISSLAAFVSRVKTTLYSENDLFAVSLWANSLLSNWTLRGTISNESESNWTIYKKNLFDRLTWPLRKTIELALHSTRELPRIRQQEFARCLLLKTAQWALDCKKVLPSASQFRDQFERNLGVMKLGASALRNAVKQGEEQGPILPTLKTKCLHRSVIGVDRDPRIKCFPAPSLVLTSPPYPGVHMLYHRWQIQGRRETAAPFWIAGCQDGDGAAYYNFGDRKQVSLLNYYANAYQAFCSVARLSNRGTLVVQLLAFSDPTWQLQKYLETMWRAGFEEVFFPNLRNSPDGRIWRLVPNRRWYASSDGPRGAANEVVLFHRLARANA